MSRQTWNGLAASRVMDFHPGPANAFCVDVIGEQSGEKLGQMAELRDEPVMLLCIQIRRLRAPIVQTIGSSLRHGVLRRCRDGTQEERRVLEKIRPKPLPVRIVRIPSSDVHR